MSAAEATAPRTVPWWVVASGLLASALVVVAVWIVAAFSGSDWFGNTPSLGVLGNAFQIARGAGHREKTAIVLESAAGGVAVLSVNVVPFSAGNYPRVEWRMYSALSPGELAFAWRTREQPGRTFTKPLHWLTDGVAPLNMGGEATWRGTITGLGLVVRGSLPTPLEIESVRLPSATAGATLRETIAQWTAYFPLKGYAVAFPFDAERAHFLPAAMAIAIAIGLAIAAYLLLARWRHRPIDARVPWAIFAAGWILLDARWQINLGHHVAHAFERYGGKTSEEKPLAAEDAALFELARDLKSVLPPPPARIVVLSDNPLIVLRIAYYLYPHNVSRALSIERESRDKIAPPDPAGLRSGDYVVLFFYAALGYDADRQLLVWPDGRTLSAVTVLAKPNTLLVRVQ